jgi:transcriptional regulator with PAS, ATPase and Fis domain
MVEVYKTIARAAPGLSTVLILGESGTGKELVARAIHRHSARRDRAFVAVDCTALTETLLESELFGHMRGSFTGAVHDAPGLFTEADGGTIFLDEIGDITPPLQAKLLRVLQEHEVRPVGGTQWRPVDVRVVAATNRDLTSAVSNGQFREDLYYRLKVVTILLPPLRERRDDIPLLVDHLVRRAAVLCGKPVSAVSDAALAALRAYDWPGNVRELSHILERSVALAQDAVIGVDDLPSELRGAPLASTPGDLIGDSPTLEAEEALHPPRSGAQRQQHQPRRRHPRARAPVALPHAATLRHRPARRGVSRGGRRRGGRGSAARNGAHRCRTTIIGR